MMYLTSYPYPTFYLKFSFIDMEYHVQLYIEYWQIGDLIIIL